MSRSRRACQIAALARRARRDGAPARADALAVAPSAPPAGEAHRGVDVGHLDREAALQPLVETGQRLVGDRRHRRDAPVIVKLVAARAQLDIGELLDAHEVAVVIAVELTASSALSSNAMRRTSAARPAAPAAGSLTRRPPRRRDDLARQAVGVARVRRASTMRADQTRVAPRHRPTAATASCRSAGRACGRARRTAPARWRPTLEALKSRAWPAEQRLQGGKSRHLHALRHLIVHRRAGRARAGGCT